MTCGIAALALIPQPAAKLLTGAALLAVAIGRVMRQVFFAVPQPAELADYPFDMHHANPWERHNGPVGL